MIEIKIEKNIPVAERYDRTEYPTFPFKEMTDGDSFYIPVGKFTSERLRAQLYIRAKEAKVLITVRKTFNPEPGFRVWKLQDKKS